ncbi:MAG: U32 family peptidase [Alistipes sp.]|nr:U32 family peptidase [Alistipes sp.]
MRQIELLIPARDLDAGKAAVDHGADAVYIGGPAFGARGAAGNPVADIARLADYTHPYGVRVYAALNTLVYEPELRQAETLARELVSAGVDALIVQDTAFLMMGIEGVAFHASTQMCNTTAGRVRFLGRSGFSRVVLERGLTLDQVRRITAEGGGVETECFVHGAICVGHSGRCYLSRSMGPRSGNRGVCGQPCRMKYDLTDGQGNKLVGDKYLLSVRDLNLSDRLGELIDAGVTSFKVEGRLKETEYVKNVTAFYRQRLDREIAARGGIRHSSDGYSRYGFIPDPSKSFSRGFTRWTADGLEPGSASFDTPKSMGEKIGKVSRTYKDSFTLDSPAELSPGDGICFLNGGELTGTNINRVEGGRIFPNRTDGVKPGTEIYRNYDHRFGTRLASSQTRRAIPVQITYTVVDGVLEVTATDAAGITATAALQCKWGAAKDRERMAAVVQSQLSKSGGTVFEVTQVSGAAGTEMPFLPVAALNSLRRELLDNLVAERLGAYETSKQSRLASVARDDKYPYPDNVLGGDANVTNTLARRFWTMHGVVSIDEAYDLRSSLDGEVVMVTPYCILRETGRCAKETRTAPPGTLYLRSGRFRYRLGFDCRECRMTLTKWKRNDEVK